jgi:crotonobetainyl-CoA:carnitine CoA-transferase CaiB-like acyl-CoA transferase
LLAELGADVVKIEAPGSGDGARRMPPFKQGRRSRSHPQASGPFFYYNAGKRGISLRPVTAEGRPLFDSLVRQADVLIEDRHPGLLDELGLGYAALRKRNPGLVLVSVTPFGQTGPYARYKAYPLNLFHAGGEGYIQPGGPGYAAHPDRPPLMAGGNFSEAVCGSTAAAGVLAALLRRNRTGRGDHVDLSCQEALMELGRAEVSAFPNEGFIEERRIRWINLGGLLRTADGWVEMVVTEPRMWEGLVPGLGRRPALRHRSRAFRSQEGAEPAD